MEKNYLQNLNSFAHLLLRDRSFEELNKIIVEEALNITGAKHGCLFLKHRDTLKKGYASPLFPNKAIKKGSLERALHTKKILTLQDGCLALPLIHENMPLAVIILYFEKKDFFTENVWEMMDLFRSIATFGFKKAMAQNELKHGLELRDRFISIASHELRTPLTSINGYIQLLRGKINKETFPESRWVESLYAESVRLTTRMKELLDINRINQGKFAFVFGEVSMRDVVEKAIERSRLTVSDHPIIFVDNIKDNHYTVIGDFDKLVEMVSGLLSNAIKFSPPHSQISVSLSNATRTISIIVKDTGKGISPKDLTAIFQGFYKSNVGNLEGMGVGLFLAKHIVTHHRGKIKVYSKENKGTTVEVSLPSAKI